MSLHKSFTPIAKHLLAQRTAATPASEFSPELSPKTMEEAIAVQLLMVELSNNEIAGWKCLQPLNDGSLIIAPILKEAVQNTNECPIIAQDNQALLEPEIAFVLGQDIKADKQHTEAEIDAAIASTHMALELIQKRFSTDYEASFPEKLADGLTNQGVFIGPEIDKDAVYQAREINLSFTTSSEKREFEGKHPTGLPQAPIYWLVNYLANLGVDLKKGQAIITGSYKGIIRAEMDQLTTIEYQGLGKYDVTFKNA